MSEEIRVKHECGSCHGTGLYSGMGESEHAAVVCRQATELTRKDARIAVLTSRVAELENANVEQGAILEAIMGALKGEEPSDFMRSFPDVEHAWWIYLLTYPTAK